MGMIFLPAPSSSILPHTHSCLLPEELLSLVNALTRYPPYHLRFALNPVLSFSFTAPVLYYNIGMEMGNLKKILPGMVFLLMDVPVIFSKTHVMRRCALDRFLHDVCMHIC